MRNQENPILPIGKSNFKTGRCKYFNMFETWGDNSTVEIYNAFDGSEGDKFRAVITSGTEPIYENGKREYFIHDQTRRFLFWATKLDHACFGDKEAMKRIIDTYGHKITAYVYK
jgi:hypothetical protein